MIRHGVVRCAYAQAYDSTAKENKEGYSIGGCHWMRFECVERQGDEEENPSTGKVRVDIDGFVV